ncbi:MAG: helix-turn-helix transcriptional regulator [Clostridia bacterium]|nr:helix-turn-helix transcriptional regulator [Clostridia bacterium]
MPNEKHVTRRFNRSVLILMAEGELKFLEDGKLITLTPGEYYIQRDGLLQQGVGLSSLPVYFFIEFSATYSESQSGLPLRGRFDHKKVASFMESCESQFVKKNSNAFKLNSYMLRIFSELLESTPASNENNTLAERVRNFIDSQYNSQVSLSDIAKKFGYTEEYILRIFKKHYGTSPHQYLIKLRMEHAMWLLENTDISVEQTALSVGYTDFSAFYRSFKKTYGTSPGVMKKK